MPDLLHNPEYTRACGLLASEVSGMQPDEEGLDESEGTEGPGESSSEPPDLETVMTSLDPEGLPDTEVEGSVEV